MTQLATGVTTTLGANAQLAASLESDFAAGMMEGAFGLGGIVLGKQLGAF